MKIGKHFFWTGHSGDIKRWYCVSELTKQMLLHCGVSNQCSDVARMTGSPMWMSYRNFQCKADYFIDSLKVNEKKSNMTCAQTNWLTSQELKLHAWNECLRTSVADVRLCIETNSGLSALSGCLIESTTMIQGLF